MKSQFDAKKIEKASDSKLELYKLALEKEMNEGHVLWQSSQSFLIANTIVIAFISQGILTTQKQINYTPNLGLFVLSIVGLIISTLWLGTYKRRSNYYKFRMAQARQREPEKWHLVREEGRFFAEGDTVEIKGEKYSLGIARFFKTSTVVTIFISLFIILYLITFFVTSPWKIILK